MKVTRILQSDTPPELAGICKIMGFVRADIWRRLGALGTMGKNEKAIRKEITAASWYADLAVDGTIRAETTKDAVNDVLTYKSAAMLKVRQAVAARTTDKAERKRLYTLLKKDEWLADNFLHRQVRKHFRHGVSHTANQFIVRSDKHSSAVVDGKFVITIHIAKQYGSDIRLTTTSNGKNVQLGKSNLRIIVKDGCTEIHYATGKAQGRASGEQMLGVDKGYTEAFVDSNGQAHGKGFGAVLTEYSDQTAKTMQQRNKLHALEKRHRAAGHIAKAERIRQCNLGRIKLEARKERCHQRLRTIAFQSAHTLVDKAGVVVSEDLTTPIAAKQQWKQYNRRMGSWAKGTLSEALDSVCVQRNAKHILVNAAYTSQMDSTTGLLEGKRVGDKFYRTNGDVLQADHNAALNVLARAGDSEITRFMPYKQVRATLLARSPDATERHGLELGVQARQPSADQSRKQL